MTQNDAMSDHEGAGTRLLQIVADDQGLKVSAVTSVVLTLLPFLLIIALFAILIPRARRAKAAGHPWTLPGVFGLMGIGLLLVFVILFALTV